MHLLTRRTVENSVHADFREFFLRRVATMSGGGASLWFHESILLDLTQKKMIAAVLKRGMPGEEMFA
jgi:hypothetical protein